MTKLLTAREVAETLRVDRSTVYEWAREGWLPSVALTPGTVRFREGDVEEFVQKRARVNGNGSSHLNNAHQQTASANPKQPYKVSRRRLLR